MPPIEHNDLSGLEVDGHKDAPIVRLEMQVEGPAQIFASHAVEARQEAWEVAAWTRRGFDAH